MCRQRAPEPRCYAFARGNGTMTQLVQTHFETYRAQAARLRADEGLPGFVEQSAVLVHGPYTFFAPSVDAGVHFLSLCVLSGGGACCQVGWGTANPGGTTVIVEAYPTP